MFFNSRLYLSTLLLSLIFSFSNTSQAARIIQQRDSRILVEVDATDQIFVDQKFLLINSENKRVALGSVTQVKNNRAILTIEKGQYTSPATIRFVTNTSTASTSTPSATTNTTSEPIMDDANSVSEVGTITDEPTGRRRAVYRVNANKFSLVATLSSNNMITKQTDGSNPTPNTEDVNLKGSSIGLTGIMDMPVNDWLTVRGSLGYEPFNVTGSSQFLSCDKLTSTDCNAYINYISGGGYARFDLTKGKSLFWVGLGGTFKFPMSKKTTALLEDDIKTTMTIAVATGMDFFISNKNFIPASLEYQMFQSSDTVKASIIMLRAGYGWAF
ncbi:hypothetical protein [Pseudobdellovibrio exovorus]|uniref:Outer membrane protein beta-barrel domain-containing protein n=1 Tax=Pseudobdellovibrio exovorus JSS TaxID=1184267 RepID=M4VB91_9BACT|nr:hypothetical protein [Pseudobdellovibrio exovorus]AGH95750.1 hypothetical protein A11Q_1534 [Pseudobdellovibrio exovorus JSS]